MKSLLIWPEGMRRDDWAVFPLALGYLQNSLACDLLDYAIDPVSHEDLRSIIADYDLIGVSVWGFNLENVKRTLQFVRENSDAAIVAGGPSAHLVQADFVVTSELPYMVKNGGGSIINMSSVSGQYGGPRTAHYAASKAGLISLSQVVARFGAKNNIRSNTVAAGIIESEMGAEGLQAKVVQQAAANVIVQRFGTSDEVASVVLFLASEESSYITVQTINVNGGLYS